MAGLIATQNLQTVSQFSTMESPDFPDHHASEMRRSFDPKELISTVFTTEQEQEAFTKALVSLKFSGADVKIGGRILREAMGCSVIDYTKGISSEIYSENDARLLGPLVRVLQQYPEERMLKPDLDLYFEGMEPLAIKEILSAAGMNVEIKNATGGISIIVVQGSGGEATFVRISDSWQQTEDAIWPKLAIKANFTIDPEPKFDLDSYYGSFFLYPLISTMSEQYGPLEPRRFSTISRILLWFLTVKDPEGNWLKPPDKHTQNLIYQSVFYGHKRIHELVDFNYDDSINYRGSLRDFALAMRILLLVDWEEMAKSGYPAENINFIRNIMYSWPPTGIAKAQSGRDCYLNIK
jgi:hypothetical protein